MAATQARGGFGTKLLRDSGGGTFVIVAEVGDINGPTVTQLTEDATNQDSPNGWSEKVSLGLKEAGDVTLTLHFLQDDAGQNQLRLDAESFTLRNFRIVFPSGTKRKSFSAFVTSVGAGYPVRGKMMSDVTLSITGAVINEAHP